MSSKDKDYRLVTLVTDVCPLPLRELFLKYAKSDKDPGLPFSTLDNYMTFRKHDVEKLMKLPPKTIRKDQFALIYPKADIPKWDVSLLTALLLGLFGSSLQMVENNLIRIIRDVRNKLQHKPGNVITDDKAFDSTWNDLETATTTLAQITGGQAYERDIRALIQEARVNNLPKLGDTLKSWFDNTFRNYGEAAESSFRILDAVTEKRVSQAGNTRKRIKTVDAVLKKLSDQFEMTITRALPVDFEQPEEAVVIRQKLEQDNHVTVCGYEQSKYLACVLSVIREKGYKRCVEMTNPEDWRHIDPEEVDLVLYNDPFSLSMTNPQTKKDLNNVFDGLMHVLNLPKKESKMDVVVVTDMKKLEENSNFESHRIFENKVMLFQPTNAEEPVDLVKHQTLYSRTQNDNVLGNMIAYSDAFIQHRKSDVIDPALLESAKEKFKRHKAVVITGAAGSGKTSFAVSLVSSIYERYQCVVLVDAIEWMNVKLGEVSVIIIDDFAGKFKYSPGLAESWLNRFDLIHAAVSVGKLNVIITCETTRFSKVLKNFTRHPLLNHRIKLPKRGVGIVVKEEPISDNELDINEQDQEQARNLPAVNTNTDYLNAEKQEQCLLEGKIVGELQITNAIQYCREALNGEIFVIGGEAYLALLETSNFTIIKEIALPHKVNCLSCIDEQSVVLFSKTEKKLFRVSLSKTEFELQNSDPIPIHHEWTNLIREGSRYVMCTENVVFIYDLNWKRRGTISHSNNKPLFEHDREDIFDIRKTTPNRSISDIAAGDNIIVVGSEAKIVISDENGNIIKILKRGGTNVTLYDERLFFLKMDSSISILTNTGKVVGMLFEGGIESFSYPYRYRNKFDSCLCYGKKCEKLFLSKDKNIKLLSVH